MKQNPIFKKKIRQSYNFNDGTVKTLKEWVARCPKCNKLVTAGQDMGMYGITYNSRKSAKDALYRHQRSQH